MSLFKEIENLRESFLIDLKEIGNSKEMELLKIRYLGKKGPVQKLMIHLKNLTPEERPKAGLLINELKEELLAHCENSAARLEKEELEKQFQNEKIDVTLPGRKKSLGRIHPVNILLNRAIDVFVSMGFSVQYGPHIESDFYNFEGLNFEKDHPARDMQDTFYITEDLLLRTHTSNVQVRVMEKHKPPIRVIAPGKCFRNETVSARSHVFFHQIEGFYIDKHVTFSDLMGTMKEFLEKLFHPGIKVRFRPSYFPFVEPGMEIDMACSCEKGCRICKNTGWLEICGAGMIHPEVLKSGGIDPEEYSGYAWGIGIERLAMLEYKIPDIRMFTENDLRVLSQFT